mmetsp:Transcript_13776/g.40266  ORF Transcript_13776/g.40266 Transcript_13776/m.40266 type:complete len:99 (-) Transcript_13776:1058-1354(-)
MGGQTSILEDDHSSSSSSSGPGEDPPILEEGRAIDTQGSEDLMDDEVTREIRSMLQSPTAHFFDDDDDADDNEDDDDSETNRRRSTLATMSAPSVKKR